MSNEMLAMLKNKIDELDEKRFKTEAEQKKLIETSGKFNEKIRTYVEYKNLEKIAFSEGEVKMQAINQRIRECNLGMNKIKDKLQYIKSRLENNQMNSTNNTNINNTDN